MLSYAICLSLYDLTSFSIEYDNLQVHPCFIHILFPVFNWAICLFIIEL